jgi:hypothetical protein
MTITLSRRDAIVGMARSGLATILLVCLLLLSAAVVGVAAAGEGSKTIPPGPPPANSVVGKWTMTLTFKGQIVGGPVVFSPDGSCILSKGKGRYTYADGVLTIDYPTGEKLSGPVTWVNKDRFTHAIGGLTCSFDRAGPAVEGQPPPPPVPSANSVVGRWKLTITSAAGTKTGPVSFTADGMCRLADTDCPYTLVNGVLTIDLGKSKLSGPITWAGPNRFTLNLNNTNFTFDRDGPAPQGEAPPIPPVNPPVPPANSVVGNWKMTLTFEGKTAGGPVTFNADGSCVLSKGKGRYSYADGVLAIDYPTGEKLSGPVTWVNKDRFTHAVGGLTCSFERDTPSAEGQPQPPPIPPAPPAGSPSLDQKGALLLGHWATRSVFDRVLWPRRPVTLAMGATNSQQPVITGTVDMPNTQEPSYFVYSAGPNDRLVWKGAGLPTTEYFIAEIQGDLGPNGNFFGKNYTLKFRAIWKGEHDQEVACFRNGGHYEVRLKGSMKLQGKPHQLDLHLRGDDHFDIDSSGFEKRDTYTITGTIKGPTGELFVDEAVHFTAVRGGKDIVSFDWRKINNKLVAGDQTYQWENVFLKKNFKNGKVSGAERNPPDWVCTGRVLVNGQPVANYNPDIQAYLKSSTGFLIFHVETSSGRIELERWRVDDQSPEIPL